MKVACDEMKGLDDQVRPAYAELSAWLSEIKPDVLDYGRQEDEFLFRRIVITFAAYGEAETKEPLMPSDVIPRIIPGTEWDLVRRGLEQRVKALNLYLKDIYT